MNKTVLIISSSPRKGGNSDTLCNAFGRGAEEAGNQVEKIRLAQLNIEYCSACYACKQTGRCVKQDDMAQLLEKMRAADVIVLATPVYFYTMCAQMKTMIDRFCAFNSSIQRKHMKSALLTAAWNSDDWTFEALETHYKTLVRYLNLQDMGTVLGYGCGTPSMTQHSRFPQKAYDLGKHLR